MFLVAAPGVKVMFQAPPGVPNVFLVLPVLLMLWSTQEHKNFLLMTGSDDNSNTVINMTTDNGLGGCWYCVCG